MPAVAQTIAYESFMLRLAEPLWFPPLPSSPAPRKVRERDVSRAKKSPDLNQIQSERCKCHDVRFSSLFYLV